LEAIELCYMPALELVAAIKARKVSPVEVVEAVLARIERLNPTLNAYCTLTAEAARTAAKEAEAAVMRGDPLGTLHGLPVSIKDLVATKGVRTTYGSKLYEHFSLTRMPQSLNGSSWRAPLSSAKPTPRSSGTRASPITRCSV
jgi:Asp-tRNA(Asn)/Glu-tRNA(Gln) amidotransferase A subunit family amidase